MFNVNSVGDTLTNQQRKDTYHFARRNISVKNLIIQQTIKPNSIWKPRLELASIIYLYIYFLIYFNNNFLFSYFSINLHYQVSVNKALKATGAQDITSKAVVAAAMETAVVAEAMQVAVVAEAMEAAVAATETLTRLYQVAVLKENLLDMMRSNFLVVTRVFKFKYRFVLLKCVWWWAEWESRVCNQK